MSLFDAIKSTCIASFFTIIVVSVIICVVPGFPPNVNFSEFTCDKTLPFEGPLLPNNILDEAERLYEGQLISPESIATRNGPDNEMFVSIHNGDIVKIWGDNHQHHSVVANLGPGCAGPWEEHICGRPLGMRFGPNGLLYIAEAYRGIYTLDVDKGKKELIIPSSTIVGTRKSRVVDDLDIDGDFIYWSDASSNAGLADGLVELVSDPSGRLIRSNLRTRRHEVLIPKLHFANGVQLSPKKDFVLVCETFQRRVHRYWLSGPKKGKRDIFVSGLPGMPDNLRNKPGGGYWISLINVRDPKQIDLFEAFSQFPTARKFIIKWTGLWKALFDRIDRIYPNYFCKIVSYKIFSLSVISNFIDNDKSMVVEVDEDGKIVHSLQGDSGKVKMISQATQVGDYLMLGSPYIDYLGRVKLNEPTSTKRSGAKPPSQKATKDDAKRDEL